MAASPRASPSMRSPWSGLPRPADARARRVIAYDVRDDAVRTRVAKVLEAVGERVQWSVFEADLDGAVLAEVLARLDRLVDPRTDSVRVYTLCGPCAGRLRHVGLDRTPERSRTVIV